MRKTKEENEITKQKLLSSALNVFSNLGYDKTRLEDIAQEAGYTRGAIYHNFGGKAQILKALIEEFGIRASVIVKEVYSDSVTSCQNISIFIEQSLAYMEENENYRKIKTLTMLNNLHLYEELQELCENVSVDIDVFITYLSDLLQAGIEQGEIKENINIQATAISILGLVNGISTLWLINQNGFSIKEYANYVAESFLNGLRK